jgi:V/A-type H+-transporting ATPase subunit I
MEGGGHGHGPSDEVLPPTLLKTKPWAAIVHPLFQFMGTTPGYREFDISVPFLVFFSLFFAMIVNDASYGVIITAGALLAMAMGKKRKMKPYRPALVLLATLGVADIVWGALVGEWFGSKELAHSAALEPMAVLEHMAESSTDMMRFCFSIAAVHLTIAHLMNLFRNARSHRGVGQVGWLLIVWGLYFLVCNMVAGDALPAFAMPMLGVGVVLLLSSERSAADFAHAPLAVIACFSDIISYMRLFAVGFAASIMAKSFNAMAVGDGISTPGAVAVAAVVLVGGHALNLALGFMAVIVHGVRLNLLEFSSHLGQEWTGYEYKPFKE